MALGSGIPQEVEIWHQGILGARRVGREKMNAGKKSVWKPGYECAWKQNSVWEADAAGVPKLLRPNHFTEANGRKINFGKDYFVPYVRRFTQAIRSVDPEAAIFIEAPVGTDLPQFEAPDSINTVHAGHWYDVVTLFTKNYNPFVAANFATKKLAFGPGKVRKLFKSQLAHLKEEGRVRLHNAPTLVGEFGIPFDMKKGRAYRTGDFSRQNKALNANYLAMDANLLHSTLWTYTADNTNAHGDGWNGEDLSIFSRDQQTNPQDIHSGGRALRAFVRPYATKVAGTPVLMYFDMDYRIFEFEFRHDPTLTEPTEFYIPDFRYIPDYTVEMSDGTVEKDLEKQRLIWRHESNVELHWIKIYC
jgi:hypothetical protein